MMDPDVNVRLTQIHLMVFAISIINRHTQKCGVYLWLVQELDINHRPSARRLLVL